MHEYRLEFEGGGREKRVWSLGRIMKGGPPNCGREDRAFTVSEEALWFRKKKELATLDLTA